MTSYVFGVLAVSLVLAAVWTEIAAAVDRKHGRGYLVPSPTARLAVYVLTSGVVLLVAWLLT